MKRWFNNFTTLKKNPDPSIQTTVMGGNNKQRYLNPAAIARFGLTPFIARKVVEGFISGLHKSPFHGFSVEFADHREYVAGDDLKFLDWYLYARTDHYYVKRYEEETNVRCHILMDRSASMAFGTTGITKWDYGCFLATCLAYLMIKQQDAVGLGLFGTSPNVLVPPKCRGNHLNQLMRVMIQYPPSGGTNLAGSLKSLVRNIKRRSMVVVISDLIDSPEETIKAIKLIGSHKHDVIVFHIQDPMEINLDFDGSVIFRDVESGERLEVNPSSIRAEYQQRLTELIDFYRKGLSNARIDYQTLDTRHPYEHALWHYLQKRASLGK